MIRRVMFKSKGQTEADGSHLSSLGLKATARGQWLAKRGTYYPSEPTDHLPRWFIRLELAPPQLAHRPGAQVRVVKVSALRCVTGTRGIAQCPHSRPIKVSNTLKRPPFLSSGCLLPTVLLIGQIKVTSPFPRPHRFLGSFFIKMIQS